MPFTPGQITKLDNIADDNQLRKIIKDTSVEEVIEYLRTKEHRKRRDKVLVDLMPLVTISVTDFAAVRDAIADANAAQLDEVLIAIDDEVTVGATGNLGPLLIAMYGAEKALRKPTRPPVVP